MYADCRKTLIATALLLPAFEIHARTWTKTDGTSIEAEYVGIDWQGIVTIRENGKHVRIRFDQLGSADQEFVLKTLERQLSDLRKRQRQSKPANSPSPQDKSGFDTNDFSRTRRWAQAKSRSLEELRSNEIAQIQATKNQDQQLQPFVGQQVTWSIVILRVEQDRVVVDQYQRPNFDGIHRTSEMYIRLIWPPESRGSTNDLELGAQISQNEAAGLRQGSRITIQGTIVQASWGLAGLEVQLKNVHEASLRDAAVPAVIPPADIQNADAVKSITPPGPETLTWNDDLGTAISKLRAHYKDARFIVECPGADRIYDRPDLTAAAVLGWIRREFKNDRRKTVSSFDKPFFPCDSVHCIISPIRIKNSKFDLRVSFRTHPGFILHAPERAEAQARQVLGKNASDHWPLYFHVTRLEVNDKWREEAEHSTDLEDEIAKKYAHFSTGKGKAMSFFSPAVRGDYEDAAGNTITIDGWGVTYESGVPSKFDALISNRAKQDEAKREQERKKTLERELDDRTDDL